MISSINESKGHWDIDIKILKVHGNIILVVRRLHKNFKKPNANVANYFFWICLENRKSVFQ